MILILYKKCLLSYAKSLAVSYTTLKNAYYHTSVSPQAVSQQIMRNGVQYVTINAISGNSGCQSIIHCFFGGLLTYSTTNWAAPVFILVKMRETH